MMSVARSIIECSSLKTFRALPESIAGTSRIYELSAQDLKDFLSDSSGRKDKDMHRPIGSLAACYVPSAAGSTPGGNIRHQFQP